MGLTRRFLKFGGFVVGALLLAGTLLAQPVRKTNAYIDFAQAWTAKFLSGLADPGPKWVFEAGRADHTALTGKPSDLLGPRWTMPGTLANPTVAPTVTLAAGGLLPVDTWRCTYSWRGRFSNSWNGTTLASTKNLALTVMSPPSADVVTDAGNKTLAVTIPGPYPDGATHVNIFCDRDGDGLGYLSATAFTHPTLSGSVVATLGALGGTPINNTVDRSPLTATVGGALRIESIASSSADAGGEAFLPVDLWLDNRGFASSLHQMPPRRSYTYDGGVTVFVMDGERTIFADGNIDGLIPLLDGTRGPLPSEAAPVWIRGAVSAFVAWPQWLNVDGLGGVFAPATNADLTNVKIRNVVTVTSLTWDAMTNVEISDSYFPAGLTVGASTKLILRSNRVCGSLQISSGDAVVAGNDFSVGMGCAAGGMLVLGQRAAANVENHWVVAGNSGRPGELLGWLRVYVDATVDASTLLLSNNAIDMDSSAATSCSDNAPSNGGLIAINTGDSGVGGLIQVQASSNTFRYKSCGKANIYRTASLSENSTFVSDGDVMYAETAGSVDTPYDKDLHCWEASNGMPQRSTFKNFSCTLVNNTPGGSPDKGGNRGFYIHAGCCESGAAKKELYIEDGEIYLTSALSPDPGSYGVSNGAELNNGADIYVSRVRIRKSLADTSTYNDLVVEAAAVTAGSRIIVLDSDYDPDDVSGAGGIVIRNALRPQTTAPTKCTIGDRYTDTSGAYCVCTATDTWANTSGVGTCV